MAYFVVAAPGCYVHKTRVDSGHETFASALKRSAQRGSRSVVREGTLIAGDVWYQVDDQNSRILACGGQRIEQPRSVVCWACEGTRRDESGCWCRECNASGEVEVRS